LNWQPANILSSFNHSNTAFPLEGRHARVACADCHKGSDFKLKIAHDRCFYCHTRDPHQGQFRNRSDGGDCSACHTVERFKPSTFTAARHQSSRYPLENKHSMVPCEKCHVPRVTGTVYAALDTRCVACHPDAHERQFENTRYQDRCEECHSTRGFLPSTFTLSRHDTTRFPLTHAHGAVVCSECHAAAGSTGSSRSFQFHFSGQTCTTCHRDPHEGQFSDRMNSAAPDGTVPGCAACHSTRSWLDLSRFNHETTRFPLSGMHRALACAPCHNRDAEPARSNAAVSWRAAPRVCSGCHTDVHGGQFAEAPDSGECSRCHQPFSWKPADFDRDSHTIYPLVGSHRDVPCTGCHIRKEQSPGKSIFVYRDTPRECAGCHGAALLRGRAKMRT
jgi:ribosomal protein S14